MNNEKISNLIWEIIINYHFNFKYPILSTKLFKFKINKNRPLKKAKLKKKLFKNGKVNRLVFYLWFR